MLPKVVTVEDVVNSPMIADPLHRLDCCVVSDGGGAVVLVRPEIARTLERPLVKIIGAGEAVKHRPAALRSHHVGCVALRAGRVCRGGRQAGGYQIRLDL